MMRSGIPATLEEAIDKVIAGMDPASVEFVLNPDSTPGSVHFFTGMSLRNEWGLWADSVLAQHFKTRFGLGHADDMSGMILQGVWNKVRGVPYDIDADVIRYRRFWLQQGINPLTQQPDTTLTIRPAKPSFWEALKHNVYMIRRWWGS